MAIVVAGPAGSETIVLEGHLNSLLHVSKQIEWTVERPIAELTVDLSLPADIHSKAMLQEVSNLHVEAVPVPAHNTDRQDAMGNTRRVITWRGLRSNPRVRISYDVRVQAGLSMMESRQAFPLGPLPPGFERYLKATPYAQSDNAEIQALSRRLTGRAATEHQAVTAVIEYITDDIKYVFNPPKYDAYSTLASRSGNCSNAAHLSVALLRAAGIPARFVSGTTLNKQWKIPIDSYSSLVQSIGQGGHAWIEVYFLDLGWLSYDPRQSKQFTSTRHIRESHGADMSDITDNWKGSPYAPAYSSTIDARFVTDDISIKPKYSQDKPKSYLASNEMKLLVPGAEGVRPPDIPRPPIEKPVVPPPERVLPAKQEIIIGNLDFPSIVQSYAVSGNTGMSLLDSETAEYLTSSHIYAQAFITDVPLTLHDVSLAMHKFGGDGTVYLDVVADDGDKPGLKGLRSLPVFLDRLPRKPGYDWVTFRFPGDSPESVLKKGKYWIVARRSGDAVLTWFFTPGKSFGGPRDTRSTAKGYLWEDILNYDFVFRVRGFAGPG